MVNKFADKRFPAYFWPRYEHDNDNYKANQEAVPTRGRGLIVLYAKIIRAFPDRGGFFFALVLNGGRDGPKTIFIN